MAVWLPAFTWTKERVLLHLEALAEAGFFAVSFDLREHGERHLAGEAMPAMAARVRNNRQRYFWPIIGHTAEDVSRAIDWAVACFGVTGRIVCGGVSAGGDIAVTAASLDRRITAVNACIATPDWSRHGSAEDQGAADEQSLRLFRALNPIDHLDRFAHRPWLRFDNAADDTLVPPEAARRFQALLAKKHYREQPERIEIYEQSGIGHAFHDEMWERSLRWLSQFRSAR
ncbi:CocE/NonD family hydrolase [Paenibacillus oryzisoli]|uniref:dienelactone hydrolase family protein n=1 Tax=Paenibacillus oryzisoli TaxID=1850517 RepID=UPI003D27F9A0